MSKTKILITEDEFIVSKNLTNKLVGLGYDVIGVASSGEEALEKIEQNEPDLILMDIMLAGKMDGIDAAKIINEKYDIPLIFLTAYSSKEIYRRAEITEPYAYIIKPFEERELEINISIALYKYKAEKKLKLRQLELEELNTNLDKIVRERTKELLERNKELKKEVRDRIAAEEKNKRLARVIEQAEDHILITDLEGFIEYVNPKMLSFLGYTKAEMYGEKPSILKPYERPKSIYKQMWNMILAGETYKGEFINKRKNGEIYVAQMVIVPLRNSNNEISHFAAISRDITDKREKEKRMTALVEEEKERISKELHDGIGQTLTAIKFSIGSIMKTAPIENMETLEGIKELIDQSTKEVREVSFNVMPGVLGDYGLEAAVKKLINYISENTEIKVDFHYDKKIKRFNKDIEIGIYRIIQEALNNAQKYANCSIINITIKLIENYVVLKVSDDGVGFDVNDVLTNGQGIHNMKNRTKLVEGECDIKSSINEGTSVEVIIPLNYE